MTDVTFEDILEQWAKLPAYGGAWVMKASPLAIRAWRQTNRDIQRERNRYRLSHGKHTQRARSSRG